MRVKIAKITIDPDPYEPFRLAQGYRVGDLLFIRDLSNVSKIVERRGRYFTPPYPADTIVEVTSLYSPDALIEIEAIAVADEAAERT